MVSLYSSSHLPWFPHQDTVKLQRFELVCGSPTLKEADPVLVPNGPESRRRTYICHICQYMASTWQLAAVGSWQLAAVGSWQHAPGTCQEDEPRAGQHVRWLRWFVSAGVTYAFCSCEGEWKFANLAQEEDLEDPRWASLDRIRGVWPKKYPGPLGPISYTNGAPTSPREFYPKPPFKTSYIHLPGLYEFYPPALAPKILYSLT